MATAASDARRGWYVVGLLCLLFAFSHIDRAAIVVLAAPVARDLDLSDGQIALLIGVAFSLVYSFTGLPIATLIDRANRKWIIAVGATLRALATIASGFARDFWTLAALRAGVALGEAVLTPGAVSLIADLFDADRRLRPTALYFSVNAVMGVGALVVVGMLLSVAELPTFATGIAPWRTLLVVIGVPPLLLALLLAVTVREPTRRAAPPADTAVSTTNESAGFIAYLRRNCRLYLPFYIGTGALSLYIYGAIAWVPTLLQRGFKMPTAKAGVTFGTLGLLCGLTGALLWPAVVAFLSKRAVAHPAPLALAIASLLFGPFMVAGPASGTIGMLLALLAVGMLGTAAVGVLPSVVIQNYGAPHVRARLTATLLLSQNLIGLGLGPSLVAALAGIWPGRANALGLGLSATGVAMALIAGISFLLARRTLVRADTLQRSQTW